MIFNQALLGYNITLRVAPIALAGKFFLNLAITTPLDPWALAILPHMHLDYGNYFVFSILVGSTVNVADSFSEIKLTGFLVIHILNFKQSLVLILVYFRSEFKPIYLRNPTKTDLVHKRTGAAVLVALTIRFLIKIYKFLQLIY